MIVQIDKQKYFVKWRYGSTHIIKNKSIKNGFITTTLFERYTECIISNEEKTRFIKAVVKCNVNDNFVKEIGRILSLQKAIEYFNSKDQINFLQTYKNRKIG